MRTGPPERDNVIKALDNKGVAAADIARHIGVSYERARQLLKRVRAWPAIDARRKALSEMPLDRWLDQSIADMHWLTVRTRNSITNGEGLHTPRHLLTITEAEMLRIPNFGKKSLQELRCMMAARGLKIGQDADLSI